MIRIQHWIKISIKFWMNHKFKHRKYNQKFQTLINQSKLYVCFIDRAKCTSFVCPITFGSTLLVDRIDQFVDCFEPTSKRFIRNPNASLPCSNGKDHACFFFFFILGQKRVFWWQTSRFSIYSSSNKKWLASNGRVKAAADLVLGSKKKVESWNLNLIKFTFCVGKVNGTFFATSDVNSAICLKFAPKSKLSLPTSADFCQTNILKCDQISNFSRWMQNHAKHRSSAPRTKTVRACHFRLWPEFALCAWLPLETFAKTGAPLGIDSTYRRTHRMVVARRPHWHSTSTSTSTSRPSLLLSCFCWCFFLFI